MQQVACHLCITCSSFAHGVTIARHFTSGKPRLGGTACLPDKSLVGVLSDCSAGPVPEEPVGQAGLEDCGRLSQAGMGRTRGRPLRVQACNRNPSCQGEMQ